jgi:DNA-binding transcriptional regulator YiaG
MMEEKFWTPRKIHNFRTKYRLSRRVLSLYLGVSPHTIYAWEKSLRIPSLMAMLLLSRVENDFRVHYKF